MLSDRSSGQRAFIRGFLFLLCSFGTQALAQAEGGPLEGLEAVPDFSSPAGYADYYVDGETSGLPGMAVPREGVVVWWQWWEVNRGEYLERILALRAEREKRRGGNAATDNAEYERGRAAAIDALLDALDSPDPLMREGAAIGLGRMKAAGAVDRLIGMARGDPHGIVRRACWVSLGLIGGDRATDALLEGRVGLDSLRDAVAEPMFFEGRKVTGDIAGAALLIGRDNVRSRATALGLFEEADARDDRTDRVINALGGVLEEQRRSPGGAVMALWAMRLHRPDLLRPIALELLRTTLQPALAGDALRALGDSGDERDVPALVSFLIDPAGSGAPVTTNLNQREDWPFPATAPFRYPWAPLSFSLMRGDAAHALGRIDYRSRQHQETVLAALREGYHRIYDEQVQWSDIHRGSILIAMGRIGGENETAFIADAMNGVEPEDELVYVYRRDGTRDAARLMGSPKRTRHYAALAAGLHLGRHPVASQRQRNSELYALAGVLAPADLRLELRKHLANEREPSGFRATCALALGLSGLGVGVGARLPDAQPNPASPYEKSQEVPHLMAAAEAAFRSGDELVFGYAMLALGLLGEDRMVNAAEAYLGPPVEQLDVRALTTAKPPVQYQINTTLAKRALVLGLAALGDRRAAGALKAAWGDNFWVNLEVARALAWCGDDSIAPDLIQLTRYADRAQLMAVSAVWSLGELFDAGHPSRLDRLMRGSNHWAMASVPINMGRQISGTEGGPLRDHLHGVAPEFGAWGIEYWYSYGNPFAVGHPLMIDRPSHLSNAIDTLNERDLLLYMQRKRARPADQPEPVQRRGNSR